MIILVFIQKPEGDGRSPGFSRRKFDCNARCASSAEAHARGAARRAGGRPASPVSGSCPQIRTQRCVTFALISLSGTLKAPRPQKLEHMDSALISRRCQQPQTLISLHHLIISLSTHHIIISSYHQIIKSSFDDVMMVL